MGAVATRVSRGGCVRSHAGRPLSPHRAIPQMAYGQETQRLHLCPTRSRAAARARIDLRQGPVSHKKAQKAQRKSCLLLHITGLLHLTKITKQSVSSGNLWLLYSCAFCAFLWRHSRVGSSS